MRRDTKTGAPDFFAFARDYLCTYMPTIRGLSVKTIEAYRISLECFLTFLTDHEHIDRGKVSFDHFDRAHLKAWLRWLADDKHYAKRTITLRLSAIKAFLAYAAAEDITLVALSQAARSLKAPAAPRKPIEYLTGTETRAVLAAFTGRTAKSRRNRMLLILLYDTAARVGDITDLTLADLSLSKPGHVVLTGKRSKSRVVPLTDKTVEHLSVYLKEFHPNPAAVPVTRPLFYSPHHGQLTGLSVDTVSAVLKQAAQAARETCPTVPENVHCHMLRKTKAMDLYQQGIPLPIIMRLLGHENTSTTAAFYAFATIDMMRAAVNAATPATDVATEDRLTEDKLQALYGLGPDDIDLLVATDSEGILGIGDQGIGGIEISIGKLAIYTAAGGIHPRRTLPVVLDVGTDNLQLLNDPLYLGERHARVRDHRYDQFLDAFVAACRAVFPRAMLHWEDFAADNARRVLHRYTDQVCSFNDDLQGTAAVTLAAITSALRVTGGRLSDQRIVIHGAGTSGTGIADLIRDTMIREGLTPDEANRRFWAVDRQGLLIDDDPTLRDFQRPYARTRGEVTASATTVAGRPVSLTEVVGQVHPTVLIGSSTQGGAFTENIVKDMAAHVNRPIILPLSNPTSMCEAVPADLLTWTDGRALVATGSPFAPVTLNGRTYRIPQSNNALIFPGLGLGVTVARATRITDNMISAASTAVAALADPTTPGAPLLPLMDDLRTVAATVATAVATTATRDGVARTTIDNPVQQVTEAMWHIDYPTLDIIDA